MKRHLILLAALTGTALAAQTAPVLNLFTVTKDGDKEILRPTGNSVKPGSVLERQMSARVSGDTTGARMVMPIDPALIYQPGYDAIIINGQTMAWAELKKNVTYSLEGKPSSKDYSLEPMKTIEVTENGKKVKKQVKAEPQDYRAVAYALGNLKKGDTVLIKQRVRLR